MNEKLNLTLKIITQSPIGSFFCCTDYCEIINEQQLIKNNCDFENKEGDYKFHLTTENSRNLKQFLKKLEFIPFENLKVIFNNNILIEVFDNFESGILIYSNRYIINNSSFSVHFNIL